VRVAIYCLTLDKEFYPDSWNDWFSSSVEYDRAHMSKDDFRIKMITRAGAFCAAELDRRFKVNSSAISSSTQNDIVQNNDKMKCLEFAIELITHGSEKVTPERAIDVARQFYDYINKK